MTDAPDLLTNLPRPSALWKQLSPERRLQAADDFWKDDNARLEQAEVIGTIAQRIKFRTKSVQAMPREKKARQLVALPGVSELVAARLLVNYHLGQQRAMMASFLDALGVKHEEGLIAEDEMQAPAADQLHAAAKTLAASYPAEDVALYLTTLMWQDPETWGGLAEAPESRLVA